MQVLGIIAEDFVLRTRTRTRTWNWGRGQCSLSSRCLEDKDKSSRTHHCYKVRSLHVQQIPCCICRRHKHRCRHACWQII